MAVPDIANTWGDIRQGVKDAEILISQKKYNLSMIKSRQVLELMVNYLCINASIAEEDLASSVDALYDYQWIDKTTCEHYLNNIDTTIILYAVYLHNHIKDRLLET